MANNRIVFTAALGELAEVPGSPFSYWAPPSLRELFHTYPPLDRDAAQMPDQPKIADVKVGLQTSDDLRFTRHWWEVPADAIATSREETRRGKRWAPFAKGGSPFYHDIQLVVNWENEGEEIKQFDKAVIRNESFYFRAGLAWALIAKSQHHGFDMFAKPAGSIHDVASNSIFLDQDTKRWPLLAIGNGILLWRCFVLLDPTAHNRVPGYVAKLPIEPHIFSHTMLSSSAREAHDLLREWAAGEETATVFAGPWLLLAHRLRQGGPLPAPITGHPLARDFAWSDWESARAIRAAVAQKAAAGEGVLWPLAQASVLWERLLRARLADIQRQIDDEVYRLYGISDEDRALIERELGQAELAEEEAEEAGGGEEAEPAEEEEPAAVGLAPEEHIRRLVHYLAHRVIRDDADGIVPLADGHTADGRLERGLAHRVRQVLGDIFGEEAMPTVERELRRALGKSLEEWLGEDFFGYHVGLFRRRPVIWQIVPPAGRGRSSAGLPFSVFIYWHRLDDDTLRKVRAVYLPPYLDAARREVEAAERKLAGLQAEGAPFRQQKEAERDLQEARGRLDALEKLAGRLDALLRPHTLSVASRSEWVKEKVNEIVAKGYHPNRDYGVRVNIEPLKQAGVLPRDAGRIKG